MSGERPRRPSIRREKQAATTRRRRVTSASISAERSDLPPGPARRRGRPGEQAAAPSFQAAASTAASIDNKTKYILRDGDERLGDRRRENSAPRISGAACWRITAVRGFLARVARVEITYYRQPAAPSRRRRRRASSCENDGSNSRGGRSVLTWAAHRRRSTPSALGDSITRNVRRQPNCGTVNPVSW